MFMFQTNLKRFIPKFGQYPHIVDIVVPNLAVNVRAAVEKGLVSPLATQPTYGEEELSEHSINGHYIDDPLDMLNAARLQSGASIAANSVIEQPKTD